MRIWTQKSASIQKRTSPLKFDNFAEKSEKDTVSYLSTKASTRTTLGCAPRAASCATTSPKPSPILLRIPRGKPFLTFCSCPLFRFFAFKRHPRKDGKKEESSSLPSSLFFSFFFFPFFARDASRGIQKRRKEMRKF